MFNTSSGLLDRSDPTSSCHFAIFYDSHMIMQALLSLAYFCVSERIHMTDNYTFTEMIGQKPSIAILSLNLIGHPIRER